MCDSSEDGVYVAEARTIGCSKDSTIRKFFYNLVQLKLK